MILELGNLESGLCEEYLRPQRADSLWEYTKRYDSDLVEFLKKYMEKYGSRKFSENECYYVLRIDGTHFLSKYVKDFFLHLLSYSHKKSCNTLLSVAGSVASHEFAFFSTLFGGKSSEQAVVTATSMLDSIYHHAMGTGADAVVLLVDKGFNFLHKEKLKQKYDQKLVVLSPIMAVARKQLSEEQTQYVREIGRARQPVEYDFGFLKRSFLVLKPDFFRLNANARRKDGKNLSSHAKRIESIFIVCMGLYNALRRFGSEFDFDFSRVHCGSVLRSTKTARDIEVVSGNDLSRSNKDTLHSIPQIRKEDLERLFKGSYRSAQQGTQTTNLLAKGGRLVLGHHVLGIRFRFLKNSSSLLLVAVLLSSFKRETYHCAIKFGYNKDDHGIIIEAHYCSCFVGNGLCIHKAAVVSILAKIKGVDIGEIQGAKK
jgi:hypothetical protein